ncbi:hypothetical protein D3C72_1575590 [compost metagenome]
MHCNPAFAWLCQFQRNLDWGDVTTWDRPEPTLGQGDDLFQCHGTHHYQRGIVRCIPGLVPQTKLFELHALKIGHPADGRRVIATGRVGHGIEAFVGLGHRFVVGVQAAFFLDDFDLFIELPGWQMCVYHAVGFEFEGHAKVVAGQQLVINSSVVAGKGVLFSAEVAQYYRCFTRAGFVAALEHHVFQGVGQP